MGRRGIASSRGAGIAATGLEGAECYTRTRDTTDGMGYLIEETPPRPVLAAEVYRARDRRARHFAPELFSEPAWDMLLDLFVNGSGGRAVSTLGLCLAARVPPATGLRWIAKLEAHDLTRRHRDNNDRRVAFVEMTPDGYQAMDAYLSEVMVRFALR